MCVILTHSDLIRLARAEADRFSSPSDNRSEENVRNGSLQAEIIWSEH